MIDFDQGYYQCVATNCVGSIHADAKLIILNTDSFSKNGGENGGNGGNGGNGENGENNGNGDQDSENNGFGGVNKEANVENSLLTTETLFSAPGGIRYTLRFKGAIELQWKKPEIEESAIVQGQSVDYEIHIFNLIDQT